ncbi:MAG TPA: hypothetical protein VF338_07210, partial [Leptolinea sp.]
MISFSQGKDYYGFPVKTAGNHLLQMDFLETAGPRIVRLRSRMTGEVNLLAELPHLCIPTPYGDYRVLGGHRMQTSPETSPYTYIPDERPVQINQMADGFELIGPVEPETGLSRAFSVRFSDEQTGMIFRHWLTNHGDAAIQTAIWSLTILPCGGKIIMPLRYKSGHTGSLLPDRSLVFWPYSRLGAGDFKLGEKTAILDVP